MDHEARIWEILEKTGVGMLTTRFASGLRARPFEARPDRAAGVILFVSDVRGLKDDEIQRWPDVCFCMVNEDDKAYLSITGRAAVLHDHALAAKIWKKSDEVWWPDGPEDRHICVLRIEPQTAELWDGPSSSIAAAYEFSKARAIGQKPNLGENRKVTVDMS